VSFFLERRQKGLYHHCVYALSVVALWLSFLARFSDSSTPFSSFSLFLFITAVNRSSGQTSAVVHACRIRRYVHSVAPAGRTSFCSLSASPFHVGNLFCTCASAGFCVCETATRRRCPIARGATAIQSEGHKEKPKSVSPEASTSLPPPPSSTK
jgi:hypothetical protein